MVSCFLQKKHMVSCVDPIINILTISPFSFPHPLHPLSPCKPTTLSSPSNQQLSRNFSTWIDQHTCYPSSNKTDGRLSRRACALAGWVHGTDVELATDNCVKHRGSLAMGDLAASGMLIFSSLLWCIEERFFKLVSASLQIYFSSLPDLRPERMRSRWWGTCRHVRGKERAEAVGGSPRLAAGPPWTALRHQQDPRRRHAMGGASLSTLPRLHS